MENLYRPLLVTAVLAFGVLAIPAASNASMIASITNNGNLDYAYAWVGLTLPDSSEVLISNPGDNYNAYTYIGSFLIGGSPISPGNLLLVGNAAQTAVLNPLVPGATVDLIMMQGGGLDFASPVSGTLGPGTTVVPYDWEGFGFTFKGQITFESVPVASVPEPSFFLVMGPIVLFGIAYNQRRQRLPDGLS